MPSLFEEEAKRMAALNKHKHMKDNPLPTIGIILAAIIGILALLVGGWVYGVFAYGFVIAKLWTWFMVIEPFSLPAITWVQGAALFMVVRFLASSHTVKVNTKEENDKDVSDKIVQVLVPLLSPWITLFIAWVFKSVFM